MTRSVFDLEMPTLEVDLGDTTFDIMAERLAAAEHSWIARNPFGFTILHYDDVVAMLRDKRWHSASGRILELQGVTDPKYLNRRRTSILSAEGDEHTRLRRLVGKAFSPRAADRLRPFMREVIGSLVDAVAPSGRADFAVDICEPYPIPIICELLGAPRQDWELFSAWTDDIFKIFNFNVANDAPDILRAFDELDAYMDTMVADRRRALTDDLISQLIRAEDDGDRLTHDELKMLVRRGGGRPAATSRRPRDGSATCTRSPNPRSTGTASLVRLICGLALQERRHMWQGSKARVRRVIRLAGRRSFRRPSCDYGDSHSTWRLAAFGKPEVIVLLRVLSPARLRSSSAGGAPGGLVWMTWIGGHRSGRAVSVPAWR
jgi:hypothetical protein